MLEAIGEALLTLMGEIVVEGSVRSVGRAIIRYGWYFGRRGPDPEGWPCLLVGLAFWLIVGAGIFAIHTHHSGKI